MTYPIDYLIHPKEFSHLCGFKHGTFYGYARHHRTFPKPEKGGAGRTHFYDVLALAKWFAKNTDRRPVISADMLVRYPVARQVAETVEANTPKEGASPLADLLSVGGDNADFLAIIDTIRSDFLIPLRVEVLESGTPTARMLPAEIAAFFDPDQRPGQEARMRVLVDAHAAAKAAGLPTRALDTGDSFASPDVVS